MDQIKIFPKAFCTDDFEKLKETLHNGYWKWGMRSRPYTLQFMGMELKDNSFVAEYLKSKIERLVGCEMDLVRCYANAQTFGQDGTIHEDANQSDRYTFVTYIIPDKIPMNQKRDHFRVRESEGQLLHHIPIENNQGVFFPGSLEHTGLSTSRFQTYLRISVVWMFRLKYSYNALKSTQQNSQSLIEAYQTQ